ncbi:MAG: hypothetical protein HKP30_11080 [Myxococcales bacterium]|nr:hypothetical protein [Myxococcales bacterium]
MKWVLGSGSSALAKPGRNTRDIGRSIARIHRKNVGLHAGQRASAAINTATEIHSPTAVMAALS